MQGIFFSEAGLVSEETWVPQQGSSCNQNADAQQGVWYKAFPSSQELAGSHYFQELK